MTHKIIASIDYTFDEEKVIQAMLETGEYGLGQHDITNNAIIEFIAMNAFGISCYYDEISDHPEGSTKTTYSISDSTGDYFHKEYENND